MDVESSNLPPNLPRHRHHHHHQCHLARSDHVPLLLAPSVPSVTKYQSKPRPMPSGATPNRGASQPATDGSLTFGASQAPSGASLVEHSGQLTWLKKHLQLTLPQAKGWKKYDTQPWEGCNLHLHLDDAQALAAMRLPDDGSNLSKSFLKARRGAMWDQMQSSSTPPSSSRPPPPLPPAHRRRLALPHSCDSSAGAPCAVCDTALCPCGREVASGTTTAPSQTAVYLHPHGARRGRLTPPHLADTFATSLNRQFLRATRKLAADGRR